MCAGCLGYLETNYGLLRLVLLGEFGEREAPLKVVETL